MVADIADIADIAVGGLPAHGATSPRPARLLVVDDEPNIARLLQTWFELSGWEVLTAHDGLDAIALVEAVAPDVLVLDMMLPGADGLEVMRRVRALDPTIAVVIHSARDSYEDRERALGAGAAAYVIKPCALHRLEDEVCRALAGCQAQVNRTASSGKPNPEAAHGALTADAQPPVAR